MSASLRPLTPQLGVQGLLQERQGAKSLDAPQPGLDGGAAASQRCFWSEVRQRSTLSVRCPTRAFRDSPAGTATPPCAPLIVTSSAGAQNHPRRLPKASRPGFPSPPHRRRGHSPLLPEAPVSRGGPTGPARERPSRLRLPGDPCVQGAELRTDPRRPPLARPRVAPRASSGQTARRAMVCPNTPSIRGDRLPRSCNPP